MNYKMEQYKVRREIKRSGREFIFYKYDGDNYGEDAKFEDLVESTKVKGIYHKKEVYNASYSEGLSTARTEEQCMLTLPYDEEINYETAFSYVSNEDKTKFFKISGGSNIQDLNIILRLSLEPVDLGKVVV